MNAGDLDGVCCIGIVIIFIIFAAFNFIYAPTLTPMEAPDDAVTYNSNSSNVIDLIHKVDSTINVKQVAEDDKCVTEYYTSESYSHGHRIAGDVVFDISELKLNGSNNYTKPIDSAFEELVNVAKSSNHYNKDVYNITKHEDDSNFFTDPSIENGGAFLAFYDDDGKEVARLNIADKEYYVFMLQDYNGTISLSNYTNLHNDSQHLNGGNNSLEIKFNISTSGTYGGLFSTDQLDFAGMGNDSCELHIILTSKERSGNDYYCYDVVVPVEIDYSTEGNVEANYDDADYIKDYKSADIDDYNNKHFK